MIGSDEVCDKTNFSLVAYLAALKRTALDLQLLITCAQNDVSDYRIQFPPHYIDAIPTKTMRKMEVEKINSDRKYFLAVVEDTIVEIARQNTYNSMKQAINNERTNLRRISEIRQSARSTVNIDLDELRTEIFSELENKLEFSFFEESLRIELECNFLKQWKASKREMEERKIALMKEECNRKLDKLEDDKESEQVVHSLCDKFLMDQINRYRNDIEEWMNKFDADVERLDVSIQTTMDKKRRTIEKQHHLNELYDERMNYVNNFKAEKARIKFAVKIQAWWRGTMVRKNLGPFARKKKAKKGKKGRAAKKK